MKRSKREFVSYDGVYSLEWSDEQVKEYKMKRKANTKSGEKNTDRKTSSPPETPEDTTSELPDKGDEHEEKKSKRRGSVK
jgi:hypothetical protein